MHLLPRLRSDVIGSRWYWPSITIVLLVTTGTNWAARVRVVERFATATEVVREERRLLAGQQAALAHLVGRRIRWPAGLENVGTEAVATESWPRYGVVALVDSMQCGTPRSAVTQFMRRLQFNEEAGREISARLRAVVATPDAPTARSYAVGNGFSFAVYFDPGSRFANENAIPFQPIVLVADATDTIVMALSPIGPAFRFWPDQAEGVVALLGTGPSR